MAGFATRVSRTLVLRVEFFVFEGAFYKCGESVQASGMQDSDKVPVLRHANIQQLWR